MHWHTCKSLLNTLGRAVEQLAGYLAKQAKVSSRGQSTTGMQIHSLARETSSRAAKLSYEYLMR